MQSEKSFHLGTLEVSKPDAEKSHNSFCVRLPTIPQNNSFKEQLSDLEMDLGKCSLRCSSKTASRSLKSPRNFLLGIHKKINLHLQDKQPLTRAQIRRSLLQLKNSNYANESDRHIAASARTILVQMLDTLATASTTKSTIPPEKNQSLFNKRSRSSNMFPTISPSTQKRVKTSSDSQRLEPFDVVVHFSSEKLSFPLEMLTNQDFQSYAAAENQNTITPVEPSQNGTNYLPHHHFQTQDAEADLPKTLTVVDPIINSANLPKTLDKQSNMKVLNSEDDYILKFPTQALITDKGDDMRFTTINIEGDFVLPTRPYEPILSSETEIFNLNTVREECFAKTDKCVVNHTEEVVLNKGAALSQAQSSSLLPTLFQRDYHPITQGSVSKTNEKHNKHYEMEPSKKTMLEKIARHKAKLRSTWTCMTNEEKVTKKNAKKLGINIFNDPVDCLLNLDYEQHEIDEPSSEIIIAEFNEKIATINYRRLSEILTESVTDYVQFELQRHSSDDDSDSDSDNYDKKCKLRLKEIEKLAREGMEKLKQDRRDDMAAFKERLQKDASEMISWDELVKFWKSDEINSENVKMEVD